MRLLHGSIAKDMYCAGAAYRAIQGYENNPPDGFQLDMRRLSSSRVPLFFGGDIFLLPDVVAIFFRKNQSITIIALALC